MKTRFFAAAPQALVLTLASAATLLAACSKSGPDNASTASTAAPPHQAATPATPTAQAAAHDAAGIAWQHASNDAEVDAAFARAKSESKPVFVYWGAKWCPPCNQVKATLFNRQDFIERSRAFVPVYVDGDSPGAQKLGARFKVSGYPTMVLFNPQGIEMTRLPGEVEPQRYTEVLTLGMNAQRPVKEVLAQAKAGGQGLAANDWRLLAFYSWDTDQQQLVAKDGVPALLKQLADACPADQTEIATRLRLKALAAVDTTKAAAGKPSPADQAALLKLLADPAASREHMDVIANYATDIVRAASAKGTPQRAELTAAMDAALKRFEADASLSRADRIGALIAQVDLAKIDVDKKDNNSSKKAAPVKLPEALLADIREQTAKVDREITDGYERQAVITAAAYLLEQAGLGAESDALLKANLAKSHSPYYLMSELASNAKNRGDAPEALRWYEEAFNKSEGPATRLQWGASYVNALVDLAPQDEARIEKAASQLFTEAAAAPDAFYERSGRSLQRVGTKLQGWSKGGHHAAALQRLQKQLDGVCSGLADKGDAGKREACEGLLKTPAKKTA
ncbi:MAG TPA: thioredoxin fold domain-containing protein [Burkholderiaceae bacterium]